MRFISTLGLLAVLQAQTPAPPAATSPKPPAAKKPGTVKPATPAAPKVGTAKPAAVPAAKPADPNDPVVFRVGNQSMTRTEFDQFLATLSPDMQQQTRTGAGKRQLAEKVAEMMALSQEARRQKIDEQPAVKQQIAIQTEQVLASNLYQSIAKSTKPDEASVGKYYEEHKNEFEQASARHILIRFQGSRVPLKEGQKDLTEAEALAKAQELRKKIADGADFATVAKAESDDQGSGANGGELGTFGRGRMVPQFDAVVFSLPPGELSEPVKTQFGYHIIQVTERKTKTLDESKGEIEQRMGPEEARKKVEEIRKKANILLDDTYFSQ